MWEKPLGIHHHHHCISHRRKSLKTSKKTVSNKLRVVCLWFRFLINWNFISRRARWLLKHSWHGFALICTNNAGTPKIRSQIKWKRQHTQKKNRKAEKTNFVAALHFANLICYILLSSRLGRSLFLSRSHTGRPTHGEFAEKRLINVRRRRNARNI